MVTVDQLRLAVQLAIGLVFAVSALSKLRRPAAFRAGVAETRSCRRRSCPCSRRWSSRPRPRWRSPTWPAGASLLNHLNRDEVWLTEKGDGGATRLTALAEFGGDKVWRSLNLERAYLQGRFGAVPELDQFTLRRALGSASSEA